jgi:CDP-glucose 4,6-dehydratase
MRSVFVTGAYGLLGGWLAKALLDAGARVVVLKRDEVPVSALTLEGTEARCAVVHGDVTDGELLGRVLTEYDVDTVFHLAAQTIVGTANRSPLSTFETNVRGTWLLLEACRTYGAVERVVIAASDKAYGPQQELPYREDFALDPHYPYDASKAAADLIARSYWHTYRLPVAITRFANLYGGGDPNPSRLIPEAISAAIAGRRPVIRSDGRAERDYLYVEDAVDAYLAIARALDGDDSRVRGEAFNAGSGRPWSVREVVELVCEAAGTHVEPDIRGLGTPAGEIPRQFVDASKISRLTGWQPAHDLPAGLRKTVEWYRAHPEALTA